jgi:hypothetical protein
MAREREKKRLGLARERALGGVGVQERCCFVLASSGVAAARFSNILPCACACVLPLSSPYFQALANKEEDRATVEDDQRVVRMVERSCEGVVSIK